MSPSIVRLLSATLPLAWIALSIGFAAGDAAAQRPASGSETYISTAQNLPELGGEATSESFAVESETGKVAGEIVESASFHFQGGAVWTEGPLVPNGNQPVLWGISEGFGHKNGSEVKQVFGFNWGTLGAGTLQVEFGDRLGSNTSVTSNTTLTTRTPRGVDPLGNPKGLVTVRVSSIFGSSEADDAFAFTPALLFRDPPRTNRVFHADHIGAPLSLYGYGFGADTLPPIQVPPFDGAFLLLQSFVHIVPLGMNATGFVDFYLPMPDDPILIGVPLQLQLLSITNLSPLEGSFSNRLLAVFPD